MSAPFPIVHDKHGEAHCDEHQFAEFQALGWKRKGAKPAADKPAKPPADKPADHQ